LDTATYKYYVDWDNGPGQSPPVEPFLGAFDDISAYVLKSDWSYGSDSGTPGQTKAGSATITLDNSSSLFSSYNTLSDIYGKILPGIWVRITMAIGVSSEVVMWQGKLDSIVPTVGERVTISTATLQAYGPLRQSSEDADVDIAMQTDITTGTAIDLILDAAGYPAADRDIDTGLSTMSRFWARKGRVLELLRELEAQETGLLRETKDGKIQFESRAHRAGAPHATVRSTYGTGILRPWNLQQENPLLDIFNSIEAKVRTFNKSETVTLATICDVRNGTGGPPIPIANGETKVIDIEFPTPSTPSQLLAVETWGTIVLQIYTNDDGTGTDLTNAAGMILSRQEFGRTLRCTIVNGTGSAGYIVVLSVPGTAIVEGDPLTVKAADGPVTDPSTSQGKFHKRPFQNPSQWLTQLAEGQAYCDHIIALYKDPRPALRFTLKANYDATHLAEAQALDVSDRIHVTASLATFGLALNADFFVEGLHHKVDEGRTHEVQVYCRAVVTHSWPASGTSYTPKVIPGAAGGTNKVPDDLWVIGIVNGPLITFGGGAWKWNTNIDLGEFRAWYCTLAGDPGGVADLRTPAEGGTLVHNGTTAFIVTGLAADWSGCQYSIDSASQGRWYFAFRLHNAAGWSVWSDGNDTPSRVKDYRDTQPLDQQSDGPPEDWVMTWKPAPTGHGIISSATRPAIHGATIWGVVAQIKQKSVGSWIAIDDASVTLYDGSAVAHTLSNNGKRLTHAAGGFGAAKVGSLILFDVRGGAFDQAYCQWGTISNYEGWNGTLATATVSVTATWIEVQGKFRGWPITTLTDLRIKVVTPPWEWVAAGYFGAQPNRGIWAKWYIDPISGLEGDSTSPNFESDPIDVPMAVDLSDIEVRYWFDNGYSRNDDNNYGSGATSSGLCIVLADTNPILTDAALDDGAPSKQFRVTVAGDRTLANPTNAICGQLLRWCIVNDTESEIVITLDDAFRVGKIVPELERPYDKSGAVDYLPGRITEDDSYIPANAATYFGNGDEDGSFRIIRDTGSPPAAELNVQVRTGGAWVTVYTFGSSP
jgi:hypothetical protein